MTIKEYIDKVFENVDLAENQKFLQEEVLSGALEKYDDLVTNGMSTKEATDQVIKELGTPEELRKELKLVQSRVSIQNKIAFNLLKIQIVIQVLVVLSIQFAYDFLKRFQPTFSFSYTPYNRYVSFAIMNGKFYMYTQVFSLILLIIAFYFILTKKELLVTKILIIVAGLISLPFSILVLVSAILLKKENGNLSKVPPIILRNFNHSSALFTDVILVMIVFTTLYYVNIANQMEVYVSDRYKVIDYHFKNEEIEVFGKLKLYSISSNTPLPAEIVNELKFNYLVDKSYDNVLVRINDQYECEIDETIENMGGPDHQVTCMQGLNEDFPIEKIELHLYEGNKPYYDKDNSFLITDIVIDSKTYEETKKRIRR